MPNYVRNEYPNRFGGNIFTKRISEYFCIPEIARIRIIFEGHFFEYLNIHTHHSLKKFFKRAPLNKVLHWVFFMHKVYLDLLFSLKIDI